MSIPSLETVKLTRQNDFGIVQLSRATKYNAISAKMWEEFREAFQWLDEQNDVQAAVLQGEGRHFCVGIDVESLQTMPPQAKQVDAARKSRSLRQHILKLQDCLSAVERCRWPVIAAVHGACIGGGVDMIAACDIRICAADATFCVKEVDVGLAADVGSLQRLPHIIGNASAMELALTARTVNAAEAKALGLVSEVLADRSALYRRAYELAAFIAKKSPVATTGTKHVLLQARDQTVQQGLEYVASWNSSQLLTEDIQKSLNAAKQKSEPLYSRL